MVRRKSRIAIQFCYQYRRHTVEDHVLWVHGASKARFETAYQQIARTLDLPGQQDPKVDYLQLVSDWLSNGENGSWLLVLDNADDRDLWLGPSPRIRSSEKLFRPLIDYLPRGHHGRILITSRDNQLGHRLLEGKHDPIQVARLGPFQARYLLQSKISDGNELSDEDADELTDALEYLPLTITQAAAYLKEIGESVSDYLQLLRAGRSDIPEILEESIDDPGRDREASNSVFLTWRISFDQILRQNPRAADILSLMALFDRHAISQKLLRRPEERPLETKAAISKLKAFALITEEKISSTYSMHRLVQISTQRWLEHHDRLSHWEEAAVCAIALQCPSNIEYEVWPLLNDLNSHARAVLEYKISTKSSQVHRANILHTLGHYSMDQGQVSSALELLLESRTLRYEHLGLEHVDTLNSMGLLGVAYNRLKNWKESEQIQLQVLEIVDRVPTLSNRTKLKSMSRLASAYITKGEAKQGQKLQMQVLDLSKEELGSEHPDTLTAMTNLAFTYHKLKQWKKAEDLELEALRLRRQVLGEAHPDTLTVMANLALTYAAQKRWQEAGQLDQQTLDQRTQALGVDHPRTLRTMQQLARCYSRQERWIEAKKLAETVLKKLRQRHDETHPDTVRATRQLEEIEFAETRQFSASHQQRFQVPTVLNGQHTQLPKSQDQNPFHRKSEDSEAVDEDGVSQQQIFQTSDFPSLPPAKSAGFSTELQHHTPQNREFEESQASHVSPRQQPQPVSIWPRVHPIKNQHHTPPYNQTEATEAGHGGGVSQQQQFHASDFQNLTRIQPMRNEHHMPPYREVEATEAGDVSRLAEQQRLQVSAVPSWPRMQPTKSQLHTPLCQEIETTEPVQVSEFPSLPREQSMEHQHYTFPRRKIELTEAGDGSGEGQPQRFPTFSVPSRPGTQWTQFNVNSRHSGSSSDRRSSRGRTLGRNLSPDHTLPYRNIEGTKGGQGGSLGHYQQLQVPSVPSGPRPQLTESEHQALRHSGSSSNRGASRGRSSGRSPFANTERHSDWQTNEVWGRK